MVKIFGDIEQLQDDRDVEGGEEGDDTLYYEEMFLRYMSRDPSNLILRAVLNKFIFGLVYYYPLK